MILEVRIPKELRAEFLEVRILKGLRLERVYSSWRRGADDGTEAFELTMSTTQANIT